MPDLKHLPVKEWPDIDRRAFDSAYLPGDIFDDTTGPGVHLGQRTRIAIEFAYRRWLGFLAAAHPEDLARAPAERITPARVCAYVEHLNAEVRATTTATTLSHLLYAARLIGPAGDWTWLKELTSRLAARARTEDRFDRLVPPVQTLNLGIELMETAVASATMTLTRSRLQYRDGLLIALLSLWPIRRRSVAALTVSRHLVFDDAGISILLHAADTKANRAESFRVPPELVPYFLRYLREVRPALLASTTDDGFWASRQRRPICEGRIYTIVRARRKAKFGKDMGVHDFRRAAASFVAIDAPDKIGLIPGILQHTKPEVSEQHYNLAGAMSANRRFNKTMSDMRKTLVAKHPIRRG